MENRKIAGLVLIIVGIGIVLIRSTLLFPIGVTCIIGGIYFSRYPRPIPGRRSNIELVKLRSKLFFIVGTIIIVLAILVIMADIGLRMYIHYFSGIYAMSAFLAYLFGLLLVVYSIHLVRNIWVWLDFPIFIVVFYIGQLFAPNLPEMPMPYRLGWLLIFPLNYVALLILFLATINKK